jgi:hypothetical protein
MTDFGDFTPPYPVKEFNGRGHVADSLAAVFETFDRPDSGNRPGDGLDINISFDGWTLITKPYCWCEREDCAYCAGEFDPHDIHSMGISAHRALNLEPEWRALGFVQGHGAPNLWLRHEDGFDARLWWYKYVGRGMEWMHSPNVGWGDIHKALKYIAENTAHITQRRFRIDLIAHMTGQDYDTLHNRLDHDDMSDFVESLYEQLKAKSNENHDIEKIERTLSRHSKVPAKKRDGTPLSLAWRLQKTLEDPKRNLK